MMRFSLQAVICCCLFTTVVPLIRGDPGGPLGAQRKSRFIGWLQSHISRDPHTQLSAPDVQISGGQSQHEGRETSLQSASFEGNIRSKRSSGCNLITCIIHKVAYDVSIYNRPKPCAPKEKTGPNGYGRRRRTAQHTSQTETPKTSSEATQPDSSLRNPCFKA